MTTCGVCGRACPDGDAFCGACGHPLAGTPAPSQPVEPPVVNVRVVNSFWDSCVGCVGWVVGVAAIAVFVGWIAGC